MKKDAAPISKAIKIDRGFQIRALLFVILLILVSLSVSAAVIYLTVSQELSKSFFSAHRDLRNIWQGLLPAMVYITALCGFLTSIIAIFGLYRIKHHLEGAGGSFLREIELLGKGNLKVDISPEAAGHLQPVVKAADMTIQTFKTHLQEVKNASMELHRVVMRLNYIAYEEEEVTIADIKREAANLDSLSKELTNSLKWFEL